MVERDADVFRSLQSARAALGAETVELVRADAQTFLRTDAGPYDVVFLDPPFRLNLLPRLLPLLPPRLRPGARVYLESAELPSLTEGFELLRKARAGQVHSLLLKWRDHEDTH
jgi:16S rRNA G966 N2-methylase RsmD